MLNEFHRLNLVNLYYRLTPAYLVVLGFNLTWLPHIGSGPLWNTTAQLESDRCLKSWWANLLYVNNYVNTDNLVSLHL